MDFASLGSVLGRSTSVTFIPKRRRTSSATPSEEDNSLKSGICPISTSPYASVSFHLPSFLPFLSNES
jgi:hypothetical protein